jgi:hypothetical protein
MKPSEAIVGAALAISLAGCVVRGTPKTAAVPATPQPAAPAAPAPEPPPQPLSIPQTEVQLPPAQPLSAEAMATLQPPEPATGPVTNPTRTTRRNPSVTNTPAQPRPEAPAPVTPAPVAPAPAPPPAEAHPLIQEIVPAGEQKRLLDSAEGRKREIQQSLNTLGHKRLNRHQQTTVSRIRAFVRDSDDAQRRGDMRQADALAERAQMLLRELQNEQ